MLRPLRWCLLLLIAAPAFAQSNDVIIVLKTYGYQQTGPTTQTLGRCFLGISGQVRISGAGLTGELAGSNGVSLPVTVNSDGTFAGSQSFTSASLMNTAFPDGIYTLRLTSTTQSYTSPIPLFTGNSITPVLFSNYTALQAWPAGLPLAPAWAPIPGATQYDYIGLDLYDANGDLLSSETGYDSSLLATATAGTISAAPVNQELEIALVYGQESVYATNGGASFVYVDVGFDVGVDAFVSAPPVIVSQPTGTAIVAGSDFSLSVTASSNSSSDLSYQWYKNGVALPGATSSSYHYSTATTADSGSYTVVVSNPGGTVTSSTAAVSVAPYNPGRIVNLSINTISGNGDQTLTAGFVIAAGTGNATGGQPVLVRGIGPTLGGFGVAGALADPTLQLIASGAPSALASNDDWGGTALLTTEMSAVGAFQLSPSSADAVVYQPSLAPGGYSALVAGKNGGTGVALAEVYDATPSGTYLPSSPRLSNISGRAQVTTGNNLTGGFTVGGTSSLKVLIRASGPALAGFGLSGLANPSLALFQSGSATPIATNTGWGGTSALSAAFAATGAFPWTNPNSDDCALLMTLPPGGYTAQITALNGTSGTALLEIYEVQ